MIRRGFRLLFLATASMAAVSAAIDACSHQAMAASVINLDSNQTSGSTGSTYSLGYVTNTTVTAATDSTVGALGAALGANPTFTSGGITPMTVSAAQAATIGWAAASSGSSWLAPNSVGSANGVGGTPTTLATQSNFVSGFSAAAGSAPQGFYYYTTTFTLTPGSYSVLAGNWMTDNQGVAIYLNGTSLGMTNPNQFSGPTSWSVPNSSLFLTNGSLNTLTFVVWNENYAPVHTSPQGIEIEGVITAVPEPTAIAVVASGLPVLGLFYAVRRRRQGASV